MNLAMEGLFSVTLLARDARPCLPTLLSIDIMNKKACLAATLAVLAARPAHSQQILIHLDPLTSSNASRNNQYFTLSYPTGFRIWSPGKGEVVVDLQLNPLGQPFIRRGISDDGKTVIGRRGSQHFLWTESEGLQPFGGTGFDVVLQDMSANGERILFRPDDSFLDWMILDRISGMVTVLEVPLGAIQLQEMKLSANGKHVLGFVSPLSENAVWGPTGAVTLASDLFPGQSVEITDISGDGRWLTGVRSPTSTLPGGGFRWSVATGLELLPACFGNVWPERISLDGSVVHGECVAGPSAEPYVWSEQGGVNFTFSEFAGIHAGGINTSGWVIATGGMSSDGMTYIANGGSMGTFWVDFDPVISSSFCENSTADTEGQLDVLGTPLVCDGFLVVRASEVPPMQAMTMLASTEQNILPVAGVGDLCLGAPVGRFPVGQIDSAGCFEQAVDLTALPTSSGTVPALAGATWHFQAWYREAPGQSNFTEAASVTFE